MRKTPAVTPNAIHKTGSLLGHSKRKKEKFNKKVI